MLNLNDAVTVFEPLGSCCPHQVVFFFTTFKKTVLSLASPLDPVLCSFVVVFFSVVSLHSSFSSQFLLLFLIFCLILPLLFLIPCPIFPSFQWTLTASTTMHNQGIQRIVFSPMSFFYSTPIGRMVNRFSADLDESTCTT